MTPLNRLSLYNSVDRVRLHCVHEITPESVETKVWADARAYHYLQNIFRHFGDGGNGRHPCDGIWNHLAPAALHKELEVIV